MLNYATQFFRSRSVLVALMCFLPQAAKSNTVFVGGPAVAFFVNAPWSVSEVMPPFDTTLGTLESVGYAIGADAEFTQTFANNTSTFVFDTVSGSATFMLTQGSTLIADDFVFANQQETVAPFSSHPITANGEQTVSGLILPTSPDPGKLTFSVMGQFFSTGTSPVIGAGGTVGITYTYEPFVTTPEVSGAWLTGAGILALCFFAKLRHQHAT